MILLSPSSMKKNTQEKKFNSYLALKENEFFQKTKKKQIL